MSQVQVYGKVENWLFLYSKKKNKLCMIVMSKDLIALRKY